jgi:hypothetical protein
MEKRHQKEIKFMQREINRIRDEEQYKSLFNNISVGEHLNTYTHRKIKQRQSESMFKNNNMNNGTPILKDGSILNKDKSMNYSSQKHFISHQKAMSISNNSLNSNIMIPITNSNKKTATTLRKMK